MKHFLFALWNTAWSSSGVDDCGIAVSLPASVLEALQRPLSQPWLSKQASPTPAVAPQSGQHARHWGDADSQSKEDS
eukprot:2809900-Amphidinium_carterae.1